jgi:hypothetical protein
VNNDFSVVSYTPGTNFVEITLKNLCGQQLDIQTTGVQITWDPAIAGNTTATTITTVEFPSTGTGSAILTVNDTAAAGATTTRALNLTPPPATTPPARQSILADSDTYVVRYNFNKILTNVNSPITKGCVIYRRPSVDTANQNCSVVSPVSPPGPPPVFNACP